MRISHIHAPLGSLVHPTHASRPPFSVLATALLESCATNRQRLTLMTVPLVIIALGEAPCHCHALQVTSATRPVWAARESALLVRLELGALVGS